MPDPELWWSLDQQGRKKFFVDAQGRTVLTTEHSPRGSFWEGLALVHTRDRLAYIDRSGAVAVKLPRERWHASDFSEGVAVVEDKEHSYGYLDVKGAFTDKARFPKLSPVRGGLGIASTNVFVPVPHAGGFYAPRNNWVSRSGPVDLDPNRSQCESAPVPVPSYDPTHPRHPNAGLSELADIMLRMQWIPLGVSRGREFVFEWHRRGEVALPAACEPQGLDEPGPFGFVRRSGGWLIPPSLARPPLPFSDGLAIIPSEMDAAPEGFDIIDTEANVRARVAASAVVSPFHRGRAVFVIEGQDTVVSADGAILWRFPPAEQLLRRLDDGYLSAVERTKPKADAKSWGQMLYDAGPYVLYSSDGQVLKRINHELLIESWTTVFRTMTVRNGLIFMTQYGPRGEALASWSTDTAR